MQKQICSVINNDRDKGKSLTIREYRGYKKWLNIFDKLDASKVLNRMRLIFYGKRRVVLDKYGKLKSIE